VLDRIAAAILLVAFAPLMALLALWIVLDDGRPVLLAQDRVGRDGRRFRMLKFRTMVPNAIQLGRDLKLTDDPYGIVANDPRITRAGHFLRRTGLDELPQLWNVLRGEMSLVGPRPDVLEQVANYSEHDRGRLAVAPGITGLAQINGREEISWPERIEQDLWYIQHWSLGLDAKILLRTVTQFRRAEERPVVDTMNIERARAREKAEST
jgi:lipopolysaccharide/colanic/teichoic acid biosynthesis glycosyltransferase